jgi:hypothetical protein
MTGPWHNCMHRQGDDLDLIEYLMCIYYEADGDNPCTKGGIRGPCARARSLRKKQAFVVLEETSFGKTHEKGDGVLGKFMKVEVE